MPLRRNNPTTLFNYEPFLTTCFARFSEIVRVQVYWYENTFKRNWREHG